MNRTTSSPDLPISLARRSGVPLRLQLERELRHAINTGRLAAGALLPSTRALSTDLDVSRGVVVDAYEQLLSEGYLVASVGSATRVARRRHVNSPLAPETQGAKSYRYDFRPGLPDLDLFPRRAWLSAIRRTLAAANAEAFDYPPPIGAPLARRALAAYLNRSRVTLARPEQIMICNGSTQAVGIVCRVLQSQGARRIAVEDPGHTDQCTDIRRLGLATPRIPVDEHGIRVDLLERARADAVLVTPAHQYPTGAVLAPERRVALLDWAVRRNAIIIEDDYDAEYRYDRGPVGALHGLAPDHVAYVGSASKVLSPALRLGWVVVPNQLTDAVADAKLGTDRGSPVLEQLAFAEFIECGAFDRHLRRTRQTYRRRRDALMTALQSRFPNLRSRGIAAGLHVLFDLPPDVNEQDVVTTAEQQGIRLYGAAGYYANPKRGVPALVLGFGGLTESAIPEAVANLAIAIGRSARSGRARGAGRS